MLEAKGIRALHTCGAMINITMQDWPPSSDFKSAFPELYEDFNNAVPAPSYTRGNGAFNIASHFPRSWVGPDLGTLPN